MPSLRQLAQSAPLLLIDAASSLIQVGLVAGDGRGRWATSKEEAGVGVFACLEELAVDPQAVPGYLFCDGPGSILGVRTVAMALRTWRVLAPKPMYAYGSLALVAHGLSRPEVGVIADARRDAWHLYQIGRGLRRVAAAELPAELATPEHFRSWAPLPKNAATVPYSLAELLPRLADADLFHPTTEPDAFLHEEPSYVTWTPQIHRAPGEKA
jgi:tRNA threonylcarbamoyladenosine biosynthesis protein TsaB